jgi:transposase-like protein
VQPPIGVVRAPSERRWYRRRPAELHSKSGYPIGSVGRFTISYRDVEDLLAERGINVDQVTIYRWVQRFTTVLA